MSTERLHTIVTAARAVGVLDVYEVEIHQDSEGTSHLSRTCGLLDEVTSSAWTALSGADLSEACAECSHKVSARAVGSGVACSEEVAALAWGWEVASQARTARVGREALTVSQWAELLGQLHGRREDLAGVRSPGCGEVADALRVEWEECAHALRERSDEWVRQGLSDTPGLHVAWTSGSSSHVLVAIPPRHGGLLLSQRQRGVLAVISARWGVGSDGRVLWGPGWLQPLAEWVSSGPVEVAVCPCAETAAVAGELWDPHGLSLAESLEVAADVLAS